MQCEVLALAVLYNELKLFLCVFTTDVRGNGQSRVYGSLSVKTFLECVQ